MPTIENIKTLAATSYDAEAYKDAYQHYSRILEQEIDNAEAWIKK